MYAGEAGVTFESDRWVALFPEITMSDISVFEIPSNLDSVLTTTSDSLPSTNRPSTRAPFLLTILSGVPGLSVSRVHLKAKLEMAAFLNSFERKVFMG